MIGIYAPHGKMGRAIIEVLSSKSLSFLEYDKKDIKNFLDKSEVIIDFSLPEGTKELLNKSAELGFFKPLVIGTTGLTEEIKNLMHEYAKKAPIVYAENFSLGVYLQKKMAELAAKLLDYDVEIFEAHHNQKKDAPSGTAKALGHVVAQARNEKLENVQTCYLKAGHEQRQKGQIGFSVARGGGLIGEHTVYFYGQNEQLHITHRGYNRSLYAEGAVKAAGWVLKQKSGLFELKDILGC